MRTGSNPEQSPKRVMLVDDHSIVRRGLRELIEASPGWQVCAEAGDGHEALALAANANPDIIIMDLSMPKMGGIDTAVHIRKLVPNAEILILTMHESDQLVQMAFNAGALGYLLKSDSGDHLMDALQSLGRHQRYMGAGAKYCLHDAPNSSGRPALLTPRERQVVRLIAEGNTNPAIANLLSISIKTVQTHRIAAMRKVGANSSADLTRYALRNGLVQI